MSFEIDYLPVATSLGANVDTQGNFVGSGYQTLGFQAGMAKSDQINKVLRQSSMMSAALATLISQRLSINVLDDGNLPLLVSELGQVFGASSASDPGINVFANTTNAQNLYNYPFAAGFWNVAGRVVRLRAAGKVTFNSLSGSMNFGIVLGGISAGFGSGGGQVVNGSNTPFDITMHLLVASAGSSGLIEVTGSCIGGQVASSFIVLSTFNGINTLTAAGVQLTCSFQSASGNNSCTQNLEICEVLV